MKIAYPAQIIKEEDGIFFVAFPDLEEAVTQGETLDEALFNAAEVLTLVMEYRIEQEQEIPEPSELIGNDLYLIAPEVNVQAALLIRKARAGRPLADLARILDASWPSVKRLENPRSSPTLKMINKAAAALGKRLVLSFE
ncbi:MAG: type II toxin-antitoxin system HicB family antitoxin [Candidatus Electronema sp. V4]|uniref:type II toxin-antitoxin system HicB family antitoxin n=1 Tax=Candidatus Electronema sp. V4 TaxID=3454756 RepID=UPI004055778E